MLAQPGAEITSASWFGTADAAATAVTDGNSPARLKGCAGISARVEDAPGGPRKLQRWPQEAPGCFRTPQGAPGGPRSPLKAPASLSPGGPRKAQEAPGAPPGSPRRSTKPQEAPGNLAGKTHRTRRSASWHGRILAATIAVADGNWPNACQRPRRRAGTSVQVGDSGGRDGMMTSTTVAT